MKTRERLGQLGLMAASALIAIVAYEAGRARADGIPAVDPLVYSGYLEQEGAPAKDASYNMTVSLYAEAGAVDPVCSVKKSVITTAGRFAVSLDKPECVEAAHASTDLWIGLKVDEALEMRSKISAVPYAVEAGRADQLTSKAIAQIKKEPLSTEQSYPNCPPGFTAKDDEIPWTEPSLVVCLRDDGSMDEVVRVGTGATSFWIDRYEASMWRGSKQFFGFPNDDSGSGAADYAKNGQIKKGKELLALSKKGVPPASSVTWFQANEACAASGKRLPTSSEWLRAARGTIDPGDVNGTANSKCNTGMIVTEARSTGKAVDPNNLNGPGTSCVSDWGAEDMIGNLSELMLEWDTGVSDTPLGTIAPWGSDYRLDATTNISSSTHGADGLQIQGLPAEVVRGGSIGQGTNAGTFALELNGAPSVWDKKTGFRCVIPR